MENCKTPNCRTKPKLTILTTGAPSIKNMRKQDYDIFINNMVFFAREHLNEKQSTLTAKDGDTND